MHSAIDLIASIVAFVSVRKADEPADDEHPYGHEKIENLAAAIEGMLILVGSGVIVVRGGPAPDRRHARSSTLGVRHRRRRRSRSSSTSSSRRSSTARARETDSPALEGDAAHLRTDALHLGRRARRAGRSCSITGADWLDPVVALLVAAAIVRRGRADPDALVARARRRGAARGGAGRDPRRDPRLRRRAASPASTSCARAGRARAATSTCTCSSRRHDARAGARDRARAPGRDPRPPRAAPTC